MAVNHSLSHSSLQYMVRNHPEPVIASIEGIIVAVSPSAVQILSANGSDELEGCKLNGWLVEEPTDLPDTTHTHYASFSSSSTKCTMKLICGENQGIRIQCRKITSPDEPDCELIYLDNDTDQSNTPYTPASAFQSHMVERIHTQQALRESEERYRTVFAKAAIGIVITNQNGQIIDANPAILDMLGYTLEEIQSVDVDRLFDPSIYDEQLRKTIATIPPSDTYRTMDLLLKTKTGEQVWTEVTSTGLHDNAGNITLKLSLVKDVTQERKSRLALQQSEHKYRCVVENIDDVIYLVDNEDTITYISDALYRARGSDPALFVGKKRHEIAFLRGVVNGGDQTHIEAIHDAIKLGKKSVVTEMTTNAAGNPHYLEIREHLLYGEDNSFLGTLGISTDITESRLYQMELKRKQEEISNIVDSIPAYVFFVDRDYCVVWANDSYTELVHRTLQDARGVHLGELHPQLDPKFKENFLQEHNTVIATGQAICNLVCECNAVPGMEYAQFDKVPFRDQTGRITGVLYVAMDVTARIQTEQKLREKEAEFRAVFDDASVGIAVVRTDGTIGMCNKALETMLGYSSDKILNGTVFDFVYPEEIRRAQTILDKYSAVGSNDYHQIQIRCINASGQTVWTKISVSTVRDSNGEASHLVCIIEDITSRKLAESRLVELHKFTDNLIDNVSEGIVVLDSAMKVLTWNGFMEKLTGIEDYDAIGNHIESLPPDTFIPSIKEDLEKVLDGETVVHRAICLSSDKDNPKYVTLNLYPNRNIEGQIEGIIQTVHDVTDHKLFSDRLIKAYDELQRANLTQKEFLNNVTHEVRTPLTAVQGYSEMLLEGVFGDVNKEQGEMIRRILASSTQLIDIVNTILELTRLNCAAPSLRLNACKPANIVRQAVRSLEPLAIRKGIDLEFHDLSENGMGTYDEQKIAVVVTNLVSNGIKFTESGLVDVTVESAGHGTVITVCDTGIGIKEAALSNIFEEFSQLPYPGKHKPSGFGIGLSIVSAMIDVMNAELTVSSVPGIGSAFTLYVPKAQLDCC